MNSSSKILFPTDFSEFSMRAFGVAQKMAKFYGTDLIVLNSLEIPNPLASLFTGDPEEELREKAYARLEELIQKHGDKDLAYLKMVKTGKPYKSVIEAAEEVSASLIVMGTHGAEGLKELFIGSNASRVIGAAPCSVLTIRHSPETTEFKKILLPLDMSKGTGEKVNVGVELAKKFDSELVVVSVMSESKPEEHDNLQKRLEKAVAYITKKGVKVSKSVLISKTRPDAVIMDFAMQSRVDLICLMTQGEDDFNAQGLGSVAERVVNHSVIPVLSVKPTKEYDEPTWVVSL